MKPTAPVRVSVLMPVYNAAPYVEEALRSISDQTFDEFELVVVDDGSNDGSAQVLSSYLAREPRMRLITRENRGLIATRNQLLQEARGELAAWMDADDISVPDRLRLQVERFDADASLVCLGSAVECIDREGSFIELAEFPLTHEAILEAQRQGGGMRFPSAMMRLECARRVGGFREPFVIGEDLDLFMRMGEQGGMANLPAVLLRYRYHGSSTSVVLGHRWKEYMNLVQELAHERRTRGSDRLQLGETVSVALTDEAPEPATITHARWARLAVANGNQAAAWKHALASIRAQPTTSIGWRTLVSVTLAAIRP